MTTPERDELLRLCDELIGEHEITDAYDAQEAVYCDPRIAEVATALKELLTRPEAQVLPAFVQKRVERALDEGLHPKGMSPHSGRIVLDASDVQALLRAAVRQRGSE